MLLRSTLLQEAAIIARLTDNLRGLPMVIGAPLSKLGLLLGIDVRRLHSLGTVEPVIVKPVELSKAGTFV